MTDDFEDFDDVIEFEDDLGAADAVIDKPPRKKRWHKNKKRGAKRKYKKPPSTKTTMAKSKRKAFLKNLSKTGQVKLSAQMAGYKNSMTMHAYYRQNEDFAKQWDEAVEAAADRLEDEAIRRAVEGVMEPEYYKGKVVGYKYKYSDSLLQFLLKGARPNKYRDNIKVEGQLKADIGVAVLPMTALDGAGWEQQAIEMHKNQKSIDLEPTESQEALPISSQTPTKLERT